MVGLCLLPLAAIAAVAVLQVPLSTVLLLGLFLLCPLMHLLTMRAGGRGADHAGHRHGTPPARPGEGVGR
jgi:hypothetical protein